MLTLWLKIKAAIARWIEYFIGTHALKAGMGDRRAHRDEIQTARFIQNNFDRVAPVWSYLNRPNNPHKVLICFPSLVRQKVRDRFVLLPAPIAAHLSPYFVAQIHLVPKSVIVYSTCPVGGDKEDFVVGSQILLFEVKENV